MLKMELEIAATAEMLTMRHQMLVCPVDVAPCGAMSAWLDGLLIDRTLSKAVRGYCRNALARFAGLYFALKMSVMLLTANKIVIYDITCFIKNNEMEIFSFYKIYK